MKTDLLPLTQTVSSPAEETEAQRIVTIDFAGHSTTADRPMALTRDTVLTRPIGQLQESVAVRDDKPGSPDRATDLPFISRPLLRLFTWYSRYYLRRHFNSLRVSRASALPVPADQPLVIYSNHASWWDPLVALLLSQEFLRHQRVFAPIDAVALASYGFFNRLGAFGVERDTRRGAGQFLRVARTILQQPGNVLWLTPQSRFADARERPASFKAGIGHLPKQVAKLSFVPVAIEYVFWEERRPEILARFGEPYETCAEEVQMAPQVWTQFFAGRLADTQNALAAEARHRQPEKFRCLLQRANTCRGIYGRWQALQAHWQGKPRQKQPGRL